MEMTSTCPSGHTVDDEAKYCSTCGASVARPEGLGGARSSNLRRDRARPRWVLPIIAASVVISIALISLLVALLLNSIAAAEREEQARQDAIADEQARAAAEQARLQQLPDAVRSCGVDQQFVLNGGREFKGIVGIRSELNYWDVDCILEALGAPDGLRKGMDVQAGDPPKSVGWGEYTLTVHYPRIWLDVTYTITLAG